MIGIFDGQCDIGEVGAAGSVRFANDNGDYTVSASGSNMWFDQDSFHYVWIRVDGDFHFSAHIKFLCAGVDPHRKAGLMVRQSLSPDAAYVDGVVHGDGLTSLQFRNSTGSATHEVQAGPTPPTGLKIEKHGAYVSMHLLDEAGNATFSGAATRIELVEPFYVGVVVCSHDNAHVESALFTNVNLKLLDSAPLLGDRSLYSTLETMSISSTDRKVRYVDAGNFEAPNWLPDDSGLIFNRDGCLFNLPLQGGSPKLIDTGFANRCNNDHGVSPDGSLLVISDQSQSDGRSLIYTLPVAGGVPRLITDNAPSYWHGWSPGGTTLTYCAQRDGKFGIFTIPATGGKETRLTTADGLDDGPEYSHDGSYIYFNSDRTGKMQIWRMRVDGSEEEQLFDDQFNNWFAHPSPDGQYIVYLSYSPETVGHPPAKDVSLKLRFLDSGVTTEIVRCLGGQGTINVPCWSPDSSQIAFVTYHMV